MSKNEPFEWRSERTRVGGLVLARWALLQDSEEVGRVWQPTWSRDYKWRLKGSAADGKAATLLEAKAAVIRAATAEPEMSGESDDARRVAFILEHGPIRWRKRSGERTFVSDVGVVWRSRSGDWYWRAERQPFAGGTGDVDWLWWKYFIRRAQERNYANKGCEPDGRAATLREAKALAERAGIRAATGKRQ